MKNKKGMMDGIVGMITSLAIGMIVIFLFLSVMLPTAFDRASEVNASSPTAYGNLSSGLTTLTEEVGDLVPIAFAIIILIMLFAAVSIYNKSK